MFPLLAIALVGYLLLSSKTSEGGGPHISDEGAMTTGQGWSIMLRGPAALPQAAIPELLRQFGIQKYIKEKTFLSSPQVDVNVLTVVTPDVVLAQVGKQVSAMGVPLTVAAIAPAPIG